MLHGTSSARTNYRFNATSITPLFQLESTGGSTAFGIVRNSNSGNAGTIYLAKSRGTTDGSNTIVQDGDRLGSLSFNGADGTDLVTAARIDAEVDGTPDTNDMPGRLLFFTTSDGASTTTERMRITSAGNVGINETNPAEKLTVDGTILTTNAPYSGNVDVPYLIAATSFYTGATTNWGTRGFQHRLKSSSGGVPRATIDDAQGNEAFCVQNGGNIGIGTDAPGYKLEVNGDIKVGELGTLWFSDTSGSIEKIESTASSLDLYADSTISFYESDASAVKFTINTNTATAYFSTTLTLIGIVQQQILTHGQLVMLRDLELVRMVLLLFLLMLLVLLQEIRKIFFKYIQVIIMVQFSKSLSREM